jgi:hypothetical protein
MPTPEKPDLRFRLAPEVKNHGVLFSTDLKRGLNAVCTSLTGLRLADEIVLRTYDGRIDPKIYGNDAAEFVAAKGGYPHPEWTPFSMADMTRIGIATESGVKKAIAKLREIGVVETERLNGQLWYRIVPEKVLAAAEKAQNAGAV